MQNTALVFVMTRGMSLSAWREGGVLGREWAMPARLGAAYRGVVVVSWDADSDRHIASELDPAPVVAGPDADEVVDAVQRFGCERAVVRTNQFSGAREAAAISDSMKCRGIDATLIVRGGYGLGLFRTLTDGPESASDERAEESLACKHAAALIGTTQDMLDDIADHPPGRVPPRFVVPNYVVPRPRLHREREQRVVFSAGRLHPQKRTDMLIRACSGLDTRLVIAGRGPLEGELRRLADEEGVDVDFCGHLDHDELRDRMATCTVYAQVSAYEGHPKTVLEAMGEGAAVLVTDTPGLGSVVRHGETGLVVGSEVDSIRSGLRQLLGDGGSRRRLGEAARTEIETELSIDIIAERELAIHRDLVGGIKKEPASAAGS